MIRALLAGTKIQTRRVLKPQPSGIGMAVWFGEGTWLLTPESNRCSVDFKAPPYAPGDRLWVREACRAEELSRTRLEVHDELDGADGVRYLADDEWRRIENTLAASDAWGALYYYRGRGTDGIGNKVPSIHMPRWASRLTLHVTNVRVQRLQEISEEDAVAEGCRAGHVIDDISGIAEGWWARTEFRELWNSLHGPDAWDANPWVVAISFTVERANIDQARHA
jgi:hypothetical protein